MENLKIRIKTIPNSFRVPVHIFFNLSTRNNVVTLSEYENNIIKYLFPLPFHYFSHIRGTFIRSHSSFSKTFMKLLELINMCLRGD